MLAGDSKVEDVAVKGGTLRLPDESIVIGEELMYSRLSEGNVLLLRSRGSNGGAIPRM